MPTYRYETASPTPRNGALVIDAPDRAAAIRSLVQRGEAPVRVEEVGETGGGAVFGRSAGSFAASGGMSRAQMAMFIRELATAVNAGLPLVQALRTIARQGRSPAQKAMLARLIDDVEHGKTLSDSMRAHGRPFDDLVISLVSAGEVAGRLGEVLTQAARLLDRDSKMRASFLAAMLYPAIIAGAVSIAVVIVVTVIVPRVLGAVAGQLTVLPWPTRVVQGVAAFVGSYWWLLILLAFGAAWFITSLLSKPGPRLAADRAILRLPVIGGALRDVSVARFTRTLGTLISAGLPVVASLRVTRDVLGNHALRAAIDDVCDQVAGGRTIAEPLEQSGWFPPLLVQIISLGEQTGRLDEMLDQAAAAFEDKTEQSIKIVTTIVPPALIIVLACLVGFVVLSILLPLIELQESIG
ncbi:MAG: type II secretion system F family protein [Phycisphaerae bacterium]|nr:type II secretion system F family protein [Phycisphaerae bacterium]